MDREILAIREKRILLEKLIADAEGKLVELKTTCTHPEQDERGVCRNCGNRDPREDQHRFLIDLESLLSAPSEVPGQYGKVREILDWLKKEYDFNVVPKGE